MRNARRGEIYDSAPCNLWTLITSIGPDCPDAPQRVCADRRRVLALVRVGGRVAAAAAHAIWVGAVGLVVALITTLVSPGKVRRASTVVDSIVA
jgi:hypothetical protein